MSRGTAAEKQFPLAFLQTFRRRSLLVAALRLAFFAALVNEGLRWLAVGLNKLLGSGLPVMSTGPFFFLVAYFIALRRWSLTTTAAKADETLDFKDRLASFVNFSDRRDIPAPIVLAQSSEVSRSLGKISLPKALPVPALLSAGPILLILSVFYPNLLTATMPNLTVNSYLQDGAFTPSGQDAPDLIVEHPDEDPDAQSADLENTSSPSPDDQDAVEGGDDAPSLPVEGGTLTGGAPAVNRPQTTVFPEQATGLVSKTTGEELSKVVEPLYSPSSEENEEEELLVGSMSFRLLPEPGSDNEEGGAIAFTEALPSQVTIDFDGIPEHYRSLVRRYFTLLAEQEDGPEKGDPL